MKSIFLTLLLFFTFTSCNKWLDIQPELEMRKTTMIETEQGFKDILIGAYISMGTPLLYGCNTTTKLPELLAQHWTIPAATATQKYIYFISNFDYSQDDSKKLLEEIWLQYYKTILNINTMLEEIDANEKNFSNGNYSLIKGEALGLRAFLHFEILRYWGCVPQNIVLDEKAIPYMKIVTKDPKKLVSVTYKEVLENIIADLNRAEELLSEDPIIHYSNATLNSPETLAGIDKNKPYPADNFHFFRQSRFNYYAVKATKARYYLYFGDKTNALENAMAVIDACDDDATSKFTFGNEQAAINGMLTFPTEHIFSVYNSLSTETLTPIFLNYQTAFTQTVAYLNTAYESTLHTSDIRYRGSRLWENRTIPLVSAPFNFFKKYNISGSSTVTSKDIPIIRLTEMYFIATECGRTDLFRTYRLARSLESSLDGTLTSPEVIEERLEKEYRKEFYGEGQMFFFYKRLNYNGFTWPVVKSMSNEKYKLTIPQSQSSFE